MMAILWFSCEKKNTEQIFIPLQFIKLWDVMTTSGLTSGKKAGEELNTLRLCGTRAGHYIYVYITSHSNLGNLSTCFWLALLPEKLRLKTDSGYIHFYWQMLIPHSWQELSMWNENLALKLVFNREEREKKGLIWCKPTKEWPQGEWW